MTVDHNRPVEMPDDDLLAARHPEETAHETDSRKRWWRFLRSPVFLLGLLMLASTASRAIWISSPPGNVGDERYYVSAGRVMVGLPPIEDDLYKDEPRGQDPNAEHPPLFKLIVGLSMKVFGDKPLGRRIPSVAFGTLAVAAMYWLARSAGAGQWESFMASTLMASENLFMVFGRVVTLDIAPVFFMIVALALYFRDRPFLAGAVLALGACTKLVAVGLLAVMGVIELLRWLQLRRAQRDARFPAPADRPNLWRLSACFLATAVAYLAVLGTLDARYSSNRDPISHTKAILGYAELTTFQAEAQIRGVQGEGASLAPATRPWHWLFNHGKFSAFHKPAAAPGHPGADRDLFNFRVSMSPFVLWLLIPAMLIASYHVWRRSDGPSTVALAWVAVMFGLLVLVALRERVGYLYYMIIVLPGVHLAIARLFTRRWMPKFATALYGLAVIGSVVAMFPFRTWGGS